MEPTDAAPQAVAEATEPAVVGTAYLARKLGVTEQTIRNYAKPDSGMPTRGQDRLGRMMFDREVALAWIRAHKAEPRHGGKRAGQGRKPRDVRNGQRLLDATTEAQRHRGGSEEGQEKTSPEGPDPNVEHKIGDLNTSEAIKEAMAFPGRFTRVEADRRRSIVEAAKAQLEYDAEAGKYLLKADVEAAWGEQLTAVRTHLESAADRLVPILVADLSLTEQQRLVLRNRLDTFMRETLAGMAADPLAET